MITVVERGTTRVMPIQGHPGHFMADGALLLPALRTAEGFPQLHYAEWSCEFPTGGMHVDFEQDVAGRCSPMVVLEDPARSPGETTGHHRGVDGGTHAARR